MPAGCILSPMGWDIKHDLSDLPRWERAPCFIWILTAIENADDVDSMSLAAIINRIRETIGEQAEASVNLDMDACLLAE